MFLNHKNNHKHPCKNPNFNMPANPDKETPPALQVVYYNNPILKGKQPVWCPIDSMQVWKILEATLHFSENYLSTKTLEGFQTWLKDSQGPLPMTLQNGKLLQTKPQTGKRTLLSKGGPKKRKELMEAIFKESKLLYYWDQECKDKLTWPLC